MNGVPFPDYALAFSITLILTTLALIVNAYLLAPRRAGHAAIERDVPVRS